MNKSDFRYRQVHMDFHTSKFIDGIGKDFDGEEFAEILKEAGVDSVTCFARCHHGYLYYNSEHNPERIHPGLVNRNLMLDQVRHCHSRGIRVPIYTTVQWDQYTAQMNPDWLAVDMEGKVLNGNPSNPGFYDFICLNSPYRQFLKEHVKEILDVMGEELDGLFFDILFKTPCACPRCRREMEKLGMDWRILNDRLKYSQMMLDEFKLEMSDFVRQTNDQCSIFYNSSHVGPSTKTSLEAYSHLELESLPSGGWGYMHFPVTIRYARNLGKNCLGMTGKFHTYWGDFHSFKNKAALEYECFSMLALNAGCSIGDQLEPNGRISRPVYDLIGSVYRQVAAKEEWCKGAEAVTEIGVLTPEEFNFLDEEYSLELHPSVLGAVRMLQEAAYQFDMIDSCSDFAKYRLLILPDNIPFNKDLYDKLKMYLQDGGRIISSYKSGLDYEGKGRFFDLYGASYLGEAPYTPDFIVPEGEIGSGLYPTEYTMYLKGNRVEALDAEVLSSVNIPYFNREGEFFCSHQHAPSSGKRGYPGILQKGKVIYYTHPIFGQYHKNCSNWCKKLVLNGIKMLLENKLVEHNGPGTAMLTLNRQPEQNRLILHLLHYIPEKRSKDIETIEDIIPLYELQVRVEIGDAKVSSMKLVPEGREIAFQSVGKHVDFVVDKVEGHRMVCIQFE